MTIVTIAPTPFSVGRGTHNRIDSEARALQTAGMRVLIITYHLGGTPPGLAVSRIAPLLFWYRKTSAGPSWGKLVLDLQLLIQTLWITIVQKPAALHAHLHEGVVIGRIVQRLVFWRRLQLVADLHGSLSAELDAHGKIWSARQRQRLQRLEAWIHRQPNQVITSSQQLQKQVAADRGSDTTVHMIADQSTLPAADAHARARTRRHYGWAVDDTVVVYAGGFGPDKGVDRFIAAAGRVAARSDQPTQVRFVCAGSPLAALKPYANEIASAAVQIISPLSPSQAADILAAADIAVDPKPRTSQQASGKLHDYQAAGVPVVCMDRPYNRAALGDTAVYAATDSPADLAAAMATLITTAPQQRRRPLTVATPNLSTQLTTVFTTN